MFPKRAPLFAWCARVYPFSRAFTCDISRYLVSLSLMPRCIVSNAFNPHLAPQTEVHFKLKFCGSALDFYFSTRIPYLLLPILRPTLGSNSEITRWTSTFPKEFLTSSHTEDHSKLKFCGPALDFHFP